MSTKTTFKRIALVAVASLGLSLVAVAPSNAAVGQWNISATSAPTTGTIGTAVTGNFSINWAASAAGDLQVSGAAIWSEPSTSSLTNASLTWSDGASASLTNTNITTGDTLGAAGSNTIWYYGDFGGGVNGAQGFTSFAGFTNAVQFKSTAAGRSVANAKVSFTPDVAGTYVIRVFAAPGATTSSLFTEWTVTVAAKTPITAATSTLTPSATALFAPKAIGSAAGNLVVVAKNAEDNASSATTSATVSGPGLVSFTNDYLAAGRAISSSGNSKTLYFFADGTSGVSTITVSSGSTVLGTQTVTYYGAVSSLTATVKKPVANTGAATSGVLVVVARDAAGVVVPSQAVTITSGSTTKLPSTSGTSSSISEASAGTATIGLTGVAAEFGTVALTIKDTATGLVSTTANVIVSSPVAAAVKMSFDKTDYLPGEKATITITATDANGLPVANQLANASGAEFAWVANLATTSTLPVEAAFSNGAMSFSMYAAGYQGAFTVGATLVGGDAWATALDDSAITATANIISDGVAQAAADSAAEATDAANAATDAANAAAEAADAATAAAQDAADAVAALAVQVNEQIAELKAQNDALRKQLIALTNLIIKIQKKVKA